MIRLLYVAAGLIISTSVWGQRKADITFNVGAACGMCENRIEEAFDVKGVISADYDLEAQQLHVVYKTKRFPDVLDLHRLAAAVGHDTDKIKATDAVYNGLNGCCKYRED